MGRNRFESTAIRFVVSTFSVAMIDNSPDRPTEAVTFGPFRLLPGQRLLLEGDQRVDIGARALSILIDLIDHAGEVVSKNELLSRVWPDTFVEEGNLRVHISGLRHALRDGQSGSRYVVNVPGRGYSFVAPVQSRRTPAASPSRTVALEPSKYQPSDSMRIIGRSDVVETLGTNLPQRRFITLIGPGGIGKTTVAVA